MVPERIWRNTAIALCAAVPLSFYVVGDLADAFPGPLSAIHHGAEDEAGPRAAAEDWERTTAPAPSGAVAPTLSPKTGSDLASRMDAHASAPVVAGNLAYSVVDADSGEVIASRDADTARVPASTLKLLTAAALLKEVDPSETLTTRAVVSEGTIVLQGEGDMTLSDDDLRTLAEGAAKLAKEQGTSTVRLAVDTSAIQGGANPAWGSNGPAGGWVTPTAAMALDEGWLDGEEYGRKSTDPVGDVAERVTELLGEQGVSVEGDVEHEDAREGAASVSVESAPLSEIVRHTLQISDNTTAELLGHLLAAARGEPTTPEGAAAALTDAVRELAAETSVPSSALDGLVIEDASGLSQQNRVPPALLSAVLGEVTSGRIAALTPILYDVPIAGLSGTLEERFTTGDTRSARGLVRGKTGYLGGASTLAGTAVLPDGRTVGYSIVVHGFDGYRAAEARAAADAVAAELVQED